MFKKIIFTLTGILIAAALFLTLAGALVRPGLEIPPGRVGRQIEVDGTKTRVWQAGSGRDVLFLHGGMGCVEDWRPLFERRPAGYRFTAFDRPGMGHSDFRADGFSPAGAAAFSERLAARLELRNVILVGHSYGGGIALSAAVKATTGATHGATKRNDNFPAAVLLIAPAAYNREELYQKQDSLVIKLLRLPYFGRGLAWSVGPLVGEGMIARVLEPMIADRSGFPEDFIRFRQRLWNNPISTTTRALQARAFIDEMPAIAKSYPRIRVPVSFVIGTDDLPELRAFEEMLLADIPALRTRRVVSVDHYLQFERPEIVLGEIERLNGAPPAR